MKVIRTESKVPKIIPVYPLETIDAPPSIQTTHNVVKVQPNNFLVDNKLHTLSNSNSSSLIDLNKSSSSNHSPKNKLINPNNHVMNNEINAFHVAPLNANGNANANVNASSMSAKPIKSAAAAAAAAMSEKADSETNIDVTSRKNIVSDKSGASRLVHVPKTSTPLAPSSGVARNILLDNAQNVAPIVSTKTKTKENVIVQVQSEENTETSSENMLR